MGHQLYTLLIKDETLLADCAMSAIYSIAPHARVSSELLDLKEGLKTLVIFCGRFSVITQKGQSPP